MKPEDKTTIKNEKENIKDTITEKQAAPKAAEPKKAGKKPSGIQSLLRQIGMALLFLAIGALAVVLSVYLPATRKLQTAQSELERLIPIETQYLELQSSYDKAQVQTMVYKLMSDTNRLQEALAENNSERINQYLVYLEEDLDELVISELPEVPTNLSAQFEKIKSRISSSPSGAANDLQDFYNDLLILADNL
jgi:hypothetical protein